MDTLRRAHAVHPIAAAQFEYAPFTLDVEKVGMFKACEELGITLVCYSPLGRGLLTGKIVRYFLFRCVIFGEYGLINKMLAVDGPRGVRRRRHKEARTIPSFPEGKLPESTAIGADFR